MATEFNLEQAVTEYIERIASEGSLLPDDARELAGHLGDSIDRLIQQGLSGEEAFLVATKRLGTQRQLATEYAKVNPSVKVNRLWAYLLFGFAGLTGLWGLGRAFLALVYGHALKGGEVSDVSYVSVIMAHLTLCGMVGLLIYHKRAIAAYLQGGLKKRPLLMVVSAALLAFATTWANNTIKLDTKFQDIQLIAIYVFNDRVVEFTFYLLIFMLFIGVANLFFTIRNPEGASLKHIFSRPAIWFLVVAGFATELLAASTRVLPPHNALLVSALYFGAVYFIGAFAIGYYNRQGTARYLFWYGIPGFVLEVGVGLHSDLGGTNDWSTLYFATGLLAGLIGGSMAGGRHRSHRWKRIPAK